MRKHYLNMNDSCDDRPHVLAKLGEIDELVKDSDFVVSTDFGDPVITSKETHIVIIRAKEELETIVKDLPEMLENTYRVKVPFGDFDNYLIVKPIFKTEYKSNKMAAVSIDWEFADEYIYTY